MIKNYHSTRRLCVRERTKQTIVLSFSNNSAHIGVRQWRERDIVSTARVCSTPVLRGGCNVARKNTVNSTATGPVCLPQKRRPSHSRIWRLIWGCARGAVTTRCDTVADLLLSLRLSKRWLRIFKIHPSPTNSAQTGSIFLEKKKQKILSSSQHPKHVRTIYSNTTRFLVLFSPEVWIIS